MLNCLLTGKKRQVCECVCVCVKFSSDRQKDLEQFLEHTRAKFVGFQVKNDHTSLAGLPQPIHEGVKVLRQVIFTVMMMMIQMMVTMIMMVTMMVTAVN